MRNAATIALVGLASSCFGQVFQGLGVVPGANSSQPYGLSSDGTTVVGSSQQFGGDAWRWTAATGRVDLGPAPFGFQMLQANDVSGNGSIIVGSMQGQGGTAAWRWTQATSVQQVIGMGGTFGPNISSDGSTIVGQSGGGGARWTQATGTQPLGPVTGLPFGNGSTNVAYGVSANGSVIVGPASALYQVFPVPLDTIVPYRWTQATGAVGILNNGQFYNPTTGAGATSISDDGTRIAGISFRTAWLWSETAGFHTLVLNPPSIPGGFSPSISGDGNTVAYREFLWTQSSGTQLLTNVLTSAGCNFTNWTDLRVIDTSFDGRTLCGYGTNPQGQTEAWYATIPGPSSTAALLALTGIATTRRQRVCRRSFPPVPNAQSPMPTSSSTHD